MEKSVLFRDYIRWERRKFGLAEPQQEVDETYEKMLAELVEDASSRGSGDEQDSFPPPPAEVGVCIRIGLSINQIDYFLSKSNKSKSKKI